MQKMLYSILFFNTLQFKFKRYILGQHSPLHLFHLASVIIQNTIVVNSNLHVDTGLFFFLFDFFTECNAHAYILKTLMTTESVK